MHPLSSKHHSQQGITFPSKIGTKDWTIWIFLQKVGVWFFNLRIQIFAFLFSFFAKRRISHVQLQNSCYILFNRAAQDYKRIKTQTKMNSLQQRLYISIAKITYSISIYLNCMSSTLMQFMHKSNLYVMHYVWYLYVIQTKLIDY